MRVRSLMGGVMVTVLGLLAPGVAAAAVTPGNSGSFVLTARSIRPPYAPTFTGNGLIATRVPATGAGYAGGTVPAQSELAGFYAKPAKSPKASERVQQRANIPSWTALTFSDGGPTFAPSEVICPAGTSRSTCTPGSSRPARWTAPDSHITDITYRVFTDRGREHVGVVSLQLRPRWSGTATVSDELDGTADRVTGPELPPVLTRQGTKSSDPANRRTAETISAMGTGITAALGRAAGAERQHHGAERAHRPGRQPERRPAHRVRGHGRPDLHADQVRRRGGLAHRHRPAGRRAERCRRCGRGGRRHAAQPRTAPPGRSCGAGRIDVAGNRTVATDVNASEFYPGSNTRDDQPWSVSPAGLSSNGYDGHIFWDAETWMFSSLLAEHPDLAAQMDAYRFARLTQAQRPRDRHRLPAGRAFHGRAPWTAPSRSRRRPRSTAKASTSSTSRPTSPSRSGSTTSPRQGPVAANKRVAGDRRGGAVLGLSSGPGARRQRPHRSRHRPRRGEPKRLRRGVHQRRGATTLQVALAAGRVTGQRGPGSWRRIAGGLVVPVAD